MGKPVRLVFAGSGSAFTARANFQSNMLLETGGEHLLIDCGGDARHSTAALGLTPRDLRSVFISHLHSDHIGGLEWLAFTTYFDPQCAKPRLIVPTPLRRPLWENSLQGGLGVIDTGAATLDTYFDVTPVAPDGEFSWAGMNFRVIQVEHVRSAGMTMMSHGLLFSAGGRRIYITTDAVFEADPARRPYDQADLIFQDCETGFRSGVHPHYDDLRTLPAVVRRKMWLYHFNPGALPDAAADGFLGFVVRGQNFDLGES